MNQNELDDAEMARAMKRGNRKPLYVALGVLGVLIVLVAASVGRARSGALSELERQGFTNVKLQMKGPFTFAFDGTKGDSKCSGSITKTPVTMSMDQMCFSQTPPPPKRSTKEVLDSSMLKDLVAEGFDKIECADVPAIESKTTCVVSASNGTVDTMDVTVKDRNADGSWHTFSWKPQKLYYVGTKLAEQVKGFLPDELAKQKAKVKDLEIDCGQGMQVVENGKVACRVTNNFVPKKPKIGAVDLDFSPEGKITHWTTKGL